jgi:hypothetical protein
MAEVSLPAKKNHSDLGGTRVAFTELKSYLFYVLITVDSKKR